MYSILQTLFSSSPVVAFKIKIDGPPRTTTVEPSGLIAAVAVISENGGIFVENIHNDSVVVVVEEEVKVSSRITALTVPPASL
jgi:hypothetical protein